MSFLTRRTFLAGSASLAGLAVSGCASSGPAPAPAAAPSPYALMYRPMPEERFPIPAVKLSRVPERYYRQQVRYPTTERVGTLVVDTSNYYLYLVQENGMAMRYGVGLGRAGFEWSGRARIARKAEWPRWVPPEDMIAREPELEQWSWKNGGMDPGLENPLGARALYIYQGNVDTLYRLHGTAEYWTIGTSVSSGCVRLINQDVIDLYQRVPDGTEVLVV
ncbi:lipoprotein-anchoring transpeptidase ErfK/SrfK [Roseibium hamelinense]|uniref:Lipoprotein-anchoring transpeptidase ErfK/SrfK n=1 Tax=Roseibium hamelinense TaxID=150831 RepID=A0A562T9Z3_9HYPH|nr:L,D-transpeptidase [Roseibium hamelinense]MTI45512.1 L,D-transpeptidase [Roseibium hamelinense]TWI90113.1 lipoprotein-anchoring transpeptidase ErfK/SrfK [Roseibium hamelinense]